MKELRELLTRKHLEQHVVRLHLDMVVTLAEETELRRILGELKGTEAAIGRAGILVVDETKLRIQKGSLDTFPDDLPPVLKDTVARLDRIIAESVNETEREKANRALAHLYKLLQQQDGSIGEAR
jgi:hypothetical protein